ncbi:MAG: histidine kinase [Lachnospiraceae bacterium]|nr:histidine kinase [Lachnospiraceae bacterium]
MKHPSLKKQMIVLWTGMASLLLAVSVFYGFYIFSQSLETTRGMIRYSNQFYADGLVRDLDDLRQTAFSIYHSNADYLKLSRASLDEFRWISVSHRLSQFLEGKVGAVTSPGGMFFYDPEKDALRSYYNASMNVINKYELDRALREYLAVAEPGSGQAGIFEAGGRICLCDYYSRNNICVGFVFEPAKYTENAENMQELYLDADGNVVISAGDLLVDPSVSRPWETNRESAFRGGSRFTVFQQGIPGTGLRLVLLQEMDSYWKILRRPEIILTVVLIPILLILFMLYMLRILRQTLLYPVELLVAHVRQVEAGGEPDTLRNGPSGAGELTRIEEYRKLSDAIESQLAKISELTEQKFEEEQKGDWARLQYYRLQINPHFYLNCLNTISMLIEKGNSVAACGMIRDLSSHFRYVFQDQQEFVTLGEELAEIRALCNIYSLRAGMPILLNEEVDPVFHDIRIPPLILETFVENSIKHRDTSGRVLNIIIRHEQKEDHTRIYVIDNGSGFSQAEIEEFNRPVERFIYQSDHVGIDNFKFRMKLLYGDKASFAFYNSPESGAVCEITIREVFHEHSDH